MSLDFKFTSKEIIEQNRTTKAKIDEIKIWLMIDSEKVIPAKIQDELIVLFLLSCNNELELTKKTIKSYYKLRKDCPDIFDKRIMEREDIQLALKTIRMVSIPVRTDDNDAIIYFSLRDSTYSNFEMLPVMKASYMIMDVASEGNPPDGIIYLVDMEGLSLMHLTKLRPDPLNKYFMYLSDGLPLKFKGMHFLNANYFLEKLLAMISTFLHPNVMKKLHVHQTGLSMDELATLIPKKCLPEELGGDLEPQEELSMKTIELLKMKEKFWEIEEKLRKPNK